VKQLGFAVTAFDGPRSAQLPAKAFDSEGATSYIAPPLDRFEQGEPVCGGSPRKEAASHPLDTSINAAAPVPEGTWCACGVFGVSMRSRPAQGTQVSAV
jgi:hypothetical protein